MTVPAAVGNLTDTFCARLLGMTDWAASPHQQRAAWVLAKAINPYAAYKYGARLYHRMRKSCWMVARTSAILLLSVSAPQEIFAPRLARLMMAIRVCSVFLGMGSCQTTICCHRQEGQANGRALHLGPGSSAHFVVELVGRAEICLRGRRHQPVPCSSKV